MLKAFNWENLLKLSGGRQVRYVGLSSDGYFTYVGRNGKVIAFMQ